MPLLTRRSVGQFRQITPLSDGDFALLRLQPTEVLSHYCEITISEVLDILIVVRGTNGIFSGN